MSPQITLIKSALSRSGGLEKYTWQIAQEFCRQNGEVTLLTTEEPSPPFQHAGLRIVSFPVKPLLSVSKILHFDKSCHEYLKQHPTPIVFSLDRNRFQTHHRAGNGAHIAYLNRRAKEEGWLKKCTFTLNPLHRTILRLEKKAFEHPLLQALFTNSQMVKEEILHYYRVDPEKIHVIHNGVEWQEMHSSFEMWEAQKQKTCQTVHLDPQAYQLLFLGHNYRRKGLEKLLKALSLLHFENFQLSVIGKDKSLPYFQHLVQQLKLSHKVFFFGPQKETMRFYQLADALVIPSLYDPFANVTVEALSMGLFVISSPHNGGKEVLTAQNGVVIPDLDDREGFADILKEAMRQHKTRERARAIRHSVQHLDFSHQLKKMSDLTLGIH